MTRAGREGWRQPHGAPIPDDMVFVADPPAAIGRVLVAWTNNGPSGPKAPPLSSRLTTIGLAAMGGFVLGLVGFFVIGGLLEHSGSEISADAFLLSLAGGALLGTLVGVLLAMRRPGVVTLFVGEDGCADLFTRGPKTDVRLTEFRDVDAFRSQVRTMTAQGIRTTLRELHLRDKKGKERLWLVSAAPNEAKADDPQYHYCEAVMRAFEEHVARAKSAE